jgi:ABC-type sugar transport systems, permease components
LANLTVPAAVPSMQRSRPFRRSGRGLRRNTTNYLLILPYLVFMVLFGVGPGLYAFLISFSNFETGVPHYFAAGIDNYVTAFTDARFTSTFGDLLVFLAVSVPLGIALVLLLALLLDMRPGRVASTLRLIFFIPGAVTGPALVLLAICMLNPDISPFGPAMKAAGYSSFDSLVFPGSLPWIFTIIGFFSGAGMWIAIQHGGLQGISKETLESAEVDGCNAWQKARYIKLPFIRPFIVYQAILIFALNVQLFVEPQLMSSTWVQANVPPQWAPNQLAYSFAFDVGNFGAAAALSLLMLSIGIAGAYVLIRWTGFFRIEA